MVQRVNFTGQEYFRDPVPEIERLRAQGPIVKVAFPIVGGSGSPPRKSAPAAS